MSVVNDYNEAVSRQAIAIEEVLDNLWCSHLEDNPVERLRTAAKRLMIASLTLKVLAGAVEDGVAACKIVEQLAGV